MNKTLPDHLRDCRRGIAKDGTWLWVVNTKTGLTSMRDVLDPLCVMSWKKSIARPLWETVSPKIPDDIFMFTFVRNPWDRVVSAYYCLRDNQGRFGTHWRQKGGARLSGDFRAYVVDGLKDDQNSIHFKPQLSTFMQNGQFIPNLYIGKFERLTHDWEVVAEKIGVSKDLPHLRKSDHKPYHELYDKKSQRVVADIYAEEIEALGYKFGD